MSRDDDARRRLARARKRLLAELTGIADAAAASALSRCPYRDRHDRCTFRGGCQNQRGRGPTAGCAGGTLDPRPAPSGPG